MERTRPPFLADPAKTIEESVVDASPEDLKIRIEEESEKRRKNAFEGRVG